MKKFLIKCVGVWFIFAFIVTLWAGCIESHGTLLSILDRIWYGVGTLIIGIAFLKSSVLPAIRWMIIGFIVHGMIIFDLIGSTSVGMSVAYATVFFLISFSTLDYVSEVFDIEFEFFGMKFKSSKSSKKPLTS